MRGAIPSLPQYVFMAWCLVKHRDSFTFTKNKVGRKMNLTSYLHFIYMKNLFRSPHSLLSKSNKGSLLRLKAIEAWNWPCTPHRYGSGVHPTYFSLDTGSTFPHGWRRFEIEADYPSAKNSCGFASMSLCLSKEAGLLCVVFVINWTVLLFNPTKMLG
jgi:hypothetical protein